MITGADSGRRRREGQLLDAGPAGMQPLLQRGEVEAAASLGDEFAVEDDVAELPGRRGQVRERWGQIPQLS